MRLTVGIVLVALVATVGDWVWFEMGIRHSPTAGALHGAILLGAVGAVLGWLNGRIAGGLVAGIAAGIGGAMAYYALASFGARGMNYTAMTAAWAAVWLVLAIVEGRFLRRPAPRSWSESISRGTLAAVASGIVFTVLLPVIWGHPPNQALEYARQFACWVAAWGTGMAAVAAGQSTGQRSEVKGQR